MSLTNASAPYRRAQRQFVRVPVVMPLVEVDIDAHGSLDVRLDREPYCANDTLTRDDLQGVLNDIATDLRTAIRVEVKEADGSTFTDIIATDISTTDPAAPAPAPVPASTVAADTAPAVAVQPALASAFGIAADGFTAGEPVEIALVVARQIADDDGTARLRLPPAVMEAHPRVVLLGRDSGVVALSEDPS